jgi:hypothetical protein
VKKLKILWLKIQLSQKLNCSSFPQRSHILGKCPIDTISDNNSSTHILASFLAAVKLKLCIAEYIENLPQLEVWLYVKVFGLDKKSGERIEGLQYNFSDVTVDDLVEEKIRGRFSTHSSSSVRTGSKKMKI